MKRVAIDRSTRWYQLPPDADQFAELEWPGMVNRHRALLDLTHSDFTFETSSVTFPARTENSTQQHRREVGTCSTISAGLLHHILCQVLLESGDIALLPDPTEPHLKQSVILAGGTPVTYSLASRTGWQYDFSNIRGDIARQARFLVVGWPHHPTGTSVSTEEFAALAALALKENLLLVIDTTYSTHEHHPLSDFDLSELARYAVVIVRDPSSTSSTATLIGHRDVTAAVETVLRSTGTLTTGGTLSTAEQQHSRDSLFPTATQQMLVALERLPIDWHTQSATSYLWGKVRKRKTSMPLVRLLHRRYAVKILPGHAYGESASAWVAVGLTNNQDVVEELAARLTRRPRLLQLLGEEHH